LAAASDPHLPARNFSPWSERCIVYFAAPVKEFQGFVLSVRHYS
jgi:hypothetical protein